VIVGAAGAEEQHTANGLAVGMWWGPSALKIETGIQAFTGTACFEHPILSVGNSPQSANQSKGWWSFANYFAAWGDGTYRYLFRLTTDDTGRYIGWTQGVDGNHSELTLFKGAAGNNLADSNTLEADTGVVGGWSQIKIEFDAGNWTAWGYLAGDSQWRELFTYDDTGNFTTMTSMNMGLNASTNETKGEAYADQWIDDCVFWDSQGDNWNSKIATLADFPRISIAHMPNTAGAKTESDAGQAAKIDEKPPDDVDNATIDETDYWTDIDDLNEGAGDPLEDLTAETIQAVMVTHVAGAFGAAEDPEMKKFNVREGGVLYADSEEDGRAIQVGNEVTNSPNNWWTFAGYFPWTPNEDNWTEAEFEGCEFGISLINTYTDQMTVQVIYFGSSFEWTAAVVTHLRQGVAIGSANALTF
jgi:hypothetical protein